MSEGQLLARLRKDARRIAKRFYLRYLVIEPEAPQVRKRFGSCDEDRVIRIRLHAQKTGLFLRYPGLIHTLCHELAHVRHMNHSKDFKELNRELLDWARERGIYRPKARG